MALGRQILDRPLDAAGNAVAGLPHAATGDAAERHDDVVAQVAAEATARDAAIAVETAARAAADALIPGTITALTGDVTAAGTGAVAAALANIPQAVLLARLAALTTDPSFNTHKLTSLGDGVAGTDAATVRQLVNAAFGVANKAALIAIDTTSMAEGAVRRVRTYRRTFWLDKTNTYTPKDGEIFAATTGGGFWVWDGSADPFWLTQTSYTVNPSTGDDEGLTTVQTRSELARRFGTGRLVAPITVTITATLLAGDTREPQVQTDLTNFITWIGVPRLLFTGTVTALTNRSGIAGQATLMTIGSIASSWTAGDGTTSFLNMIAFRDDGGGNFVASRVVRDMGSKQAWLSPPINQGNLESSFNNGDTISVYDVPSLGDVVYHNTAKAQYTWLKVAQRWLSHSGQLFMDRCWGDGFFFGGSVNNINGVSGGLFAGANLQNLGARLAITGGYHRLINVGGSCNIAQSATFKSIQVENSQVFTVVGGVFGTPDIEISTTSTNLTPLLFDGFGVVSLSCQGYVYGSTARAGSLFAEINSRNGLVSLGHMPNVTGANLISYSIASFTENVSVLATRESSDVNGNRVIGPAGPTLNDNASQPVAHLGSGGATTTNAANIGDAQAIAAAAVAGGVGSPAITALTGDVAATGPGSAAATVQPNAVTNTKLADMATARIKGRATAGAGDPEDLTGTQTTALLDVVASATKGLAPASGGGTTNFLRADGTWTAPPGTAGAAVTSLTGDVTGAGPGATATTIANDAVTNAKAANMPAHTFKANNTGSTGDPLDITGTQATADLDVFDTTHKGLAPASGGGTSNFLRADGSWATPAGTGGGGPLTGLSGDVTTTGGGVAPATISNDAVTFAKMQNIPTDTLVGRDTAGTGDPESITVGGGIEFTGSGGIQRSALTGDVSASAGSAGTVINPNVVTNSQLAQVPTGTLKGRTAAGTGNTTDLTFAAVKAALAIVFADITGTLQAAQFPALTGDVTTVAGSLVTTLAATGVGAGTYGDASHVAQVTVDAKGRVTAASSPSISISAGAVSGLSTTQTGALTGDVTKPAGSGTTTLANIPNDVPMAGDILATAIADPAVPAAGTARVYLRSTGKVWASRDENGNVSHTVRTKAAVTHQFLTAIDDDGTVHGAQPAFADLSGTISAPQIQVPANTVLGNNTGITADVLALSPAQLRTMLGLDAPRHFDINFTFGSLDGLDANSQVPTSAFIGPLAFFLSSHTITSEVTAAYAGAAIDANLITSNVWEWVPGATFGSCEIRGYCWVFDPSVPASSPIPAINLIVTRSRTRNSSPVFVDIFGTGGFGTGPTSYAFGPTDSIGIVMQGNAGFLSSGGHAKFSVHLRLTP